MKKTIIIAAALVLTAGVLSSQVKINNTPTTVPAIAAQKVVSTDRKDLGSGD